MRRAALILAALVAALLAAAAPAGAHPLGNLSVNHLAEVRISQERVDVRYLLDQAEVPTFQERKLSPEQVLERKRTEALRNLVLTVDGARVPLEASGAGKVTFPVGNAGLKTTRAELGLSAAVDSPRRVELQDRTFEGRVGWRAIVVRPGEGTAVRSSAPAVDPTNGLRRYPKGALDEPSDVRVATFSVSEGSGSVSAPGADVIDAGEGTQRESGDGFAGVLTNGDGVLFVLLLAAFGWGAVHALSPGHGKGMVAAYLVGTRGTIRDAVALGGIVTVTHTAGVFALGFVTLGLSHYVLPEDLFPWLNLVSGLLVLGVGAALIRARRRGADADHHHHGGLFGHTHPHLDHAHEHPLHMHAHAHAHGEAGGHHHHHDDHDDAGHHHHHHHDDDHAGGHDHHHGHDAGGHDHGHAAGGHHHGHDAGGHHHGHAHDDVPPVSRKSLIALGTSAGIVPCPSALVVLLAAVSQERVGLGLVLIVAFSLGLAMTLIGLGIAVVKASNVIGRSQRGGRVVAALPAISAFAIAAVGALLTFRALDQL